MKHVLAEKPFLSIQGEGIHAGKPSIFIRYAGCNLRCQFGEKCKNENERDVPDYIQKVIDNIDNYKDVKDLPVFPKYCDTYIGILPEFKRFWTEYDSNTLLAEIGKLIDGKDVDVVFTGGEPMLHQKQMIELINALYIKYKVKNITFETNGTIGVNPLQQKSWSFLDQLVNFTFSISPKISSANYTKDVTCKPEVLKSFQDTFKRGQFVLKYVVSDSRDIPNVEDFTKTYKDKGFNPNEVCLMPCGGKADDDFDKTQRRVADICVNKGYRYSPRLQMIWKNEWSR